MELQQLACYKVGPWSSTVPPSRVARYQAQTAPNPWTYSNFPCTCFGFAFQNIDSFLRIKLNSTFYLEICSAKTRGQLICTRGSTQKAGQLHRNTADRTGNPDTHFETRSSSESKFPICFSHRLFEGKNDNAKNDKI